MGFTRFRNPVADHTLASLFSIEIDKLQMRMYIENMVNYQQRWTL